MYVLSFACILIGCFETIPFHRIGFVKNGVALDFSSSPIKQEQIVNKPSDPCVRDGIFYQNCKDTEDKIVWHYHNLLKTP